MEEQTQNIQVSESGYKRNVAYKLRIGDILSGKPLIESERLKYVESKNKQIVRANLIANVIDKYIQDGERKFASITLDDASGQIKIKVFGEDISKFDSLNQGDTILIIGLLRFWYNEIYLTPEIIKKKSPEYLLIRKMEIDAEEPKILDKTQITELKDKIIFALKESEKLGGIDKDELSKKLDQAKESIENEIKKLLENGLAYEPRPGKIRWLG